MTQSTPQQSTPQHTAAQQPAPYGLSLIHI